MNLKEQILELRNKGLSYSKIASILGCVKSTVGYYCDSQHKIKRQSKRKSNPIATKIERFVYDRRPISSGKSAKSSVRHIMYAKVAQFSSERGNMYSTPTFTVEDVINKFGEHPKCYLTGKSINWNDTKSYHFDHIIPRSKGGDNSIDNLGICTKIANMAKSDMTPDELINFCKSVLENFNYQITLKDQHLPQKP